MTDDKSYSGHSRITLQWQEVVSYTLQANYSLHRTDSLHEVKLTNQTGWIETNIVPIDGINGEIRSRKVALAHFESLPE